MEWFKLVSSQQQRLVRSLTFVLKCIQEVTAAETKLKRLEK